MNQQEIYIKVSDWMEKHEEDLINDIRRIVAIPSISNPEDAVPPLKQCFKLVRNMDFIQKIMNIMQAVLDAVKKTGII